MQILKAANLALSFLLELCLLAALGSWGFRTGANTLSRILLGIGIPELLKLALYGLAVAALYAIGQPALALALGLVVIVNRFLAWLWKQEMA